MENRLPKLLITGALAFGGLGYFLFLYDDPGAPKYSASRPAAHHPTPFPSGHPSAARPSPSAEGAGSHAPAHAATTAPESAQGAPDTAQHHAPE